MNRLSAFALAASFSLFVAPESKAFDPAPLCDFFAKIVADPALPVSVRKKSLLGRWTWAKRDKYYPPQRG